MSTILQHKQSKNFSGHSLRDEHSLIELPTGSNVDPLQFEKDYYESIKTRLLNDPNYVGKYVAILKAKIIDSGDNGAELAVKVYKTYGYVPILIKKVGEDLIFTTSPRIV